MMENVTLSWNLPSLLTRYAISAHKLHEHIEHCYGGVSRSTVYRWSRGQPSKVNLRLMTKLVAALNDLTPPDEPVKLTDIFDVTYQTSVCSATELAKGYTPQA